MKINSQENNTNYNNNYTQSNKNVLGKHRFKAAATTLLAAVATVVSFKSHGVQCIVIETVLIVDRDVTVVTTEREASSAVIDQPVTLL